MEVGGGSVLFAILSTPDPLASKSILPGQTFEPKNSIIEFRKSTMPFRTSLLTLLLTPFEG